MKKLFVLSCAVLATLASCSNSEDVEATKSQKEIAFNIVADKSRAAIEGTSFSDDQVIYVSAYNSISQNYFKGVAFTKNSEGKWTGGQYWPISGVTNFLAYAATADVTSFNPTWGTNYADGLTFTVDSFYKAESDKTPYIDLLYASGEQKSEKDYSSVAMNFKHTGAWIVFNVKLAEDLADAEVTLNKFWLTKIFKGGTLSIDNTKYPGAKAAWAFSGDAADYLVEGFTAQAVSKTTPYEFGVIIPEQNQTAIKFEYTLASTAVTPAFTPQTAVYEYPLSRFEKWEMGKKYVYNVTISFNEITIEPSVENWTETSSDVNI